MRWVAVVRACRFNDLIEEYSLRMAMTMYSSSLEASLTLQISAPRTCNIATCHAQSLAVSTTKNLPSFFGA